jgi:predicted  nucleic acid-binding Zn-ribbon protein
MATPEPETSEPSDPSQPTGDMNEPHNSVSMLPEDDARARADGQAPDATLGLSSEARSLQSQSHEETLSSPNHITTSEVTSAAPQSSQVQDEHGAVRSPNPIPFTPISEKDIVSPAGFAFSRLDRRNIGLGGKQQESQQVARDEDRFAARASPNLENSAQTTSVVTLEHTASSTAAVGSDDAHYHSSATTPYESDVLSDGNQMSAESQAGESVQYQMDEQIYQEASMSDGIERRSSPVPQSEDVIYMGANLPRSAGTVPIDSVGGQRSPHVLQPFLRRPEMRKYISSPGSARLSLDRRTPPGVPARMPARDSSVKVIERRPVQQAQVQSYAHATAPDAATTGMQELLEVVQYKFKQNERQLRRAFSADSNKLRRELQQAYEENADLRSQLLAFEDRCERSEAAIVKYRGQIGKAKNLQKFLDGLGSDLHSLKRSYDAEKSSFAKRIEISETEITRLESTLASKNGFESMLSHSKASLERLLEVRGFELQSVVQHRDMLRSQLDERIGQLVEERDSRLRLEQLVAELSGSDRASLTTSIEQCKTSLMSKFGELGRQDDQLILDVAGLQDAVRRLAVRPSVSSDDFDAIKAEMHDLWLRIVQSLSAEATADMTVAEVSSSMEGIIQNHMQALHQGLARLQSASEQTANNASAHATLQLELQSAADRLRRTETELEAAKQSEVNLNDALVQSRARVSELEAEPVPAAANSTIQITSQDVEDKVLISDPNSLL